MQRVNEYRFYELGKRVRMIQNLGPGHEYANYMWALWEVREALVALKDDPVSFRISVPAVEKLIEAITEIVPIDINEAVAKSAVKISNPKTSTSEPLTLSGDVYALNEALRQFEPVLSAECTALDTYVVSQKRGYSTPDLVERAERMLSLETIAIVEDSVITDIRSAGRCLAFDIPTAAGFHVLRATEAVMGEYYKHLTGKELQKRNRNWALYLKKLKEAPGHSPKIHGALDHIRENYRNPITHPEDTLTEGEAIMLFGLALSVIELMATAMHSVPPALTELEQLSAMTEIAKQTANAPEDF